jgi:hypothetical protein
MQSQSGSHGATNAYLLDLIRLNPQLRNRTDKLPLPRLDAAAWPSRSRGSHARGTNAMQDVLAGLEVGMKSACAGSACAVCLLAALCRQARQMSQQYVNLEHACSYSCEQLTAHFRTTCHNTGPP